MPSAQSLCFPILDFGHNNAREKGRDGNETKVPDPFFLFDVIEDVIPIHDVNISVRTAKKVTSVATVPEGDPLPFDTTAGRTRFTLPKLHGHQMIEISFA